jgi:hypothetical protein
MPTTPCMLDFNSTCVLLRLSLIGECKDVAIVVTRCEGCPIQMVMLAVGGGIGMMAWEVLISVCVCLTI